MNEDSDEPRTESSFAPRSTVYGAYASTVDAARLEARESLVNTDWEVGDVILDLYEVTGVLGEGGMGRVYRVHHRGWDLDLAVKAPRSEIFATETGKERFIREAETWAHLDLHPNVAACYYVRSLGGIPTIFTEYVPEGSLSDWIRTRRLYEGGHTEALRRIVDIAIQFARGLHFAHQQGLIHQDVKPGNLLVAEDGTAKVTDFGLARARTVAAEESETIPASGPVMGTGGMTPAYCSPEQAAGDFISFRTDMWSWAVSILEMFAGEVTWLAGQAAALALEECIRREPADAMIPQMPQNIAQVLHSCLQRDPNSRPDDMLHLSAELEQTYQQNMYHNYPRELPESADLLADGFNNRAVSFLDLGRQSEAQDNLRQALTIDPNHLEATFNSCMLRWYSAFTTDLNVVLQLESLPVPANRQDRFHYLLARCRLERGEIPEGVAALQKAVKLAPKYVEYRRLLLEAHLMANDLNGAKELAEKATQLLAKDPGHIELATYIGELFGIPDQFQGYGYDEVPPGPAVQNRQIAALDAMNARVAVKITDDEMGIFPVFGRQQIPDLLVRHAANASHVSFSPSGAFLMVATYDHLDVWNLQSGEKDREVPIAADLARRLLISDKYSAIDDQGCVFVSTITGSYDVYVCLQGMQKFASLCVGHSDSILSADVDPKGEKILTAGRDGTVRLWSYSGYELHAERTPARPMYAKFSRDGDLIAVCCRDGSVHVWDAGVIGRKKIREMNMHPDFPVKVTMNYSGTLLVTSGNVWSQEMDRSEPGPMRLWEMESGRCIRSFPVTEKIQSLGFSSDERLLFCLTEDHHLKMIRLAEKRFFAGFEVCRPRSVSLILSGMEEFERSLAEVRERYDHGALVESYRALRSLTEKFPEYKFEPRILDWFRRLHRKAVPSSVLGYWSLQEVVSEHKAAITAIRFVSESQFLSGTSFGSLQVWNATNGAREKTLKGHFDPISRICVSASSILTVDQRNHLRAWNTSTWKCLSYFDYSKHEDPFQAVTIAADGRKAYSVDGKGNLAIWNLDLEELEGIITLPSGVKDAVDILPSDKPYEVFLQSAGGTWCRLNFDSGEAAPVPDPAVSKSAGPGLDVSLSGTEILLHHAGPGGKDVRITGHQAKVSCYDVSEDARYIVSGDEEGSIRLHELDWDLIFSS